MTIYTVEFGIISYDNPDNIPDDSAESWLECKNEPSFLTEEEALNAIQEYMKISRNIGSNAFYCELYVGESNLSKEELDELKEFSCIADPPKDVLLQEIIIKDYPRR